MNNENKNTQHSVDKDSDAHPVNTNSEPDLSLTEEEEAALKKKLEELRKRDPFIYR